MAESETELNEMAEDAKKRVKAKEKLVAELEKALAEEVKLDKKIEAIRRDSMQDRKAISAEKHIEWITRCMLEDYGTIVMPGATTNAGNLILYYEQGAVTK